MVYKFVALGFVIWFLNLYFLGQFLTDIDYFVLVSALFVFSFLKQPESKLFKVSVSAFISLIILMSFLSLLPPSSEQEQKLGVFERYNYRFDAEINEYKADFFADNFMGVSRLLVRLEYKKFKTYPPAPVKIEFEGGSE